MTYRVILEHRDGATEILDEFATRKEARVRIDQFRLDDEGHDEYWSLIIRDGDRVLYKHHSTNYIVDRLTSAERRSGRILMPDE